MYFSTLTLYQRNAYMSFLMIKNAYNYFLVTHTKNYTTLFFDIYFKFFILLCIWVIKMKKTIIWILLALISGALLGKFTFDRYENIDTKNVISYDNYVYMLKYGKYDNFDEMKDKVIDVDRYIYIENDDKVTAYVAIAKTKENINKIKNIYANKNINLEIVKEKIDNEEFIQNLNEYEKLLSASLDEKSLLIIEKQILSCYEELMVNE